MRLSRCSIKLREHFKSRSRANLLKQPPNISPENNLENTLEKMNKCLVFILLVIFAVNFATSYPQSPIAKCVPWLGQCQLTEQCCRDLLCLTYAAKCVPGKIPNDDRPIGDGPFPRFLSKSR